MLNNLFVQSLIYIDTTGYLVISEALRSIIKIGSQSIVTTTNSFEASSGWKTDRICNQTWDCNFPVKKTGIPYIPDSPALAPSQYISIRSNQYVFTEIPRSAVQSIINYFDSFSDFEDEWFGKNLLPERG